MAGDWIKIEENMTEKPEVLQMAAGLGIDPDAVAGKLIRVWAWAGRNCNGDGVTSVTVQPLLDRIAGVTQFVTMMRAVGWLVVDGDSLIFPRFDRHCSKTAKERANSNRRVAESRARNGKCNGQSATFPLQKPLPEKRREEKSIIPPNPQGGDEEVVELFDDQPKPERCLPAGWQKLSANERKQAPVVRNTAAMIEIGSWFGRKPTTLWRVAEAVALKTASPSTEDIAAMADYYTLIIDKDADYRRRDVITLLNNWAGELDRARIWKANNA